MFEPLHEAINAWFTAAGWQVESILRMMLAILAGGAVGLERELRGRQAGFRTYLLVSLGSALAMIVSVSFARVDWGDFVGFDNLRVDPGRIAYGVMAGVGFLGAGTIIHHRGSVRGLTTAAGIWCTAAIGLAAGFGLYIVTIAATVMVLVALWLLDYVEHVLPNRKEMIMTFRTPYRPGVAQDVAKRVKEAGFKVSQYHFHREEDDLARTEVTLRVGVRQRGDVHALEESFNGDRPDVTLIRTEPAGD